MANFLVSDKAWNRYKKVVQRFMDDDTGLQKVTWLKHIKFPLDFGEDNSLDNYTKHEILALINYDSFRTWPANIGTPLGDLDNINCALLISQSRLQEMGFLDESGYWKFDSVLDRFLINGQMYIPKGDTQVAQAKNNVLAFQIILRRQNDGEHSQD